MEHIETEIKFNLTDIQPVRNRIVELVKCLAEHLVTHLSLPFAADGLPLTLAVFDPADLPAAGFLAVCFLGVDFFSAGLLAAADFFAAADLAVWPSPPPKPG